MRESADLLPLPVIRSRGTVRTGTTFKAKAGSYWQLSLFRTIVQQPWTILYTYGCTGGGILYGLAVGYASFLLENDFVRTEIIHASAFGGWRVDLMLSFIPIGGVISSFPLVSTTIMDHFGRRGANFIGIALFFLGAIIHVVGNTYTNLCVARFIFGLAIGLLACVAPVYQSEIAQSHIRGALLVMFVLHITEGILIASVIDYILRDVLKNKPDWRWALTPHFVCSVFVFICAYFTPDSPRFLLMNGDQEGFMKNLKRLRKGAREEDIERESRIIERDIDRTQNLHISWKDILTSGTLSGYAFTGVMLQLMLTMCTGFAFIMFFGPTIFQISGFAGTKFELILAIIHFIGTFPAILFVDRIGRRPLLVWGALFNALLFLIVGIIGLVLLNIPEHCYTDQFYEQFLPIMCSYDKNVENAQCQAPYCWPRPCNNTESFMDRCAVNKFSTHVDISQCACGFSIPTFYKVILMVFPVLFMLCYSSTWMAIVWTLVGEMFPNRIRSKLIGLTVMANFAGTSAISFSVAPMIRSMGYWTFIVFAGLNLFAAGFSTNLPTTKGTHLEQTSSKLYNQVIVSTLTIVMIILSAILIFLPLVLVFTICFIIMGAAGSHGSGT